LDDHETLQLRHLITPRVRYLSGRELAQVAVRYELIDAGRVRPSAEGLSGLLPLAHSLGVTMSEAQRLTGYARQTLYSIRDADPVKQIPNTGIERIARLLGIAVVATGRGLRLVEVGDAMELTPSLLVSPARLLASQGFVELIEEDAPQKASVVPNESLLDWVRIHVSGRQLDSRSPGYAVYLKIDSGEVDRIDEVAREIVGLDEAAVIPQSTAPSLMLGPELAINIRATDQRSALEIAELLWDEICDRLQLEDRPMRVADLHLPPTAPAAPSAVLDGLIAGLETELDDETSNRIRGERDRYEGGESERVLAARCLTLAARQMREELGRDDVDLMPTIANGDAAFEELIPVEALRGQGPAIEKVRKPLQKALSLASERLGPYRGGQLGSFKGDGERPQIPREVAPSQDDLAKIARLSGKAIAAGAPSEERLIALVRAVAGLPTASPASRHLP
jgi:hypothetical protein